MSEDGAGAAAEADEAAKKPVDDSANQSDTGYKNSEGNIKRLWPQIEQLARERGWDPDNPETDQLLQQAMLDYLGAGGDQLQTTDTGAQTQARTIDEIADKLGVKDSGDEDTSSKGKKKKKKSDDEDKDSGSDSDDWKSLLSSLGSSMGSASPFGQQSSPFGSQSPFGSNGLSQLGTQSPFGTTQSPFGPNSTGTNSNGTPTANPFSLTGNSTLPGVDPLTGEVTGSPNGQDHSTSPDNADDTKVTLPDGRVVEAPTPEAARALRASLDTDDATAAFKAAGIDLGGDLGKPIAANEVQPGDVAVWSDHRSVAAGPDQVINNGEVVDVAGVTSPDDGFKGWYRPAEEAVRS